jgi:hypothetical protein
MGWCELVWLKIRTSGGFLWTFPNRCTSSIIYTRRTHDISNKLTEAVTPMTCTREVPGSSLGRDINYPDWDFS